MTAEFADYSALLGFFSEEEARKIVKSHGIDLGAGKEGALFGEIKEARAYAATIGGRRGVRPRIEEIPSAHNDYINDLKNTAVIDEVLKTGIKTYSFGLVEIAKLHIYQPYINLEYAAKLEEKVPEVGDLAATLKYCLPVRLDPANQNVSISFNRAMNTYSVVSDNLNLRVLGNADGETDVKQRFIAFTYGFGLPQISAVEFGGLVFLKNGYHRAYALLKKGHESIPCMVVKTEDFSLTGANRPGSFPQEFLLSDRSPIFSDYLSRAAVTVPRRRFKSVLTIHADAEIVQL